ncbi:hypothetical protein GQ55_3G261600 [Panicum hallii var. hallii]|jgi:hypothetical protein|uniref:Uncharacterized protein n=2 Tax=Panicum hallii TaxID=206008 RepID=A0A2T7EDI7_9POAL|nr:uncharacterized protein LOC112887468 [Panicum hallii]PAN19418.1 hypothetical protein PAHAL_3G271700 [Panicum hallii]PUZ65890.1 hypothetical protein GQ55_3G261600 [Panicum hallii var. hallii]
MDGYSNLASSPPAAASGRHGARVARPSMELTNTKETKAWEGLAIGAVTLARTFSTGSHRFRRSGSERRSRSRSGLPGALRRAFSMRRYHPAGPGCGAGDGYWRIHDMDGNMSDRGDDTVVEEHGEDEAAREEAESKKQAEQRDEDAAADTAAGNKEDAEGTATAKKKKRGGILKACKKLFRL